MTSDDRLREALTDLMRCLNTATPISGDLAASMRQARSALAAQPAPSASNGLLRARIAAALCRSQEWCDGTCPDVEGSEAIHGRHVDIVVAALDSAVVPQEKER